jgi:hypothetical protein
MQWSEVVKPPSQKVLRQFSGLFLVFFLALAGRRAWHGHTDGWTMGLAVLAIGVGLLGLLRPSAVRFIYTGWMIVAFPIGWTVSRIALALVFYIIIAPVGFVMRAVGRDELRLHHPDRPASYWRPKPGPENVREYFRQS